VTLERRGKLGPTPLHNFAAESDVLSGLKSEEEKAMHLPPWKNFSMQRTSRMFGRYFQLQEGYRKVKEMFMGDVWRIRVLLQAEGRVEALKDAVEELGHLEEYVKTMQPSKNDAAGLAVGALFSIRAPCPEDRTRGGGGGKPDSVPFFPGGVVLSAEGVCVAARLHKTRVTSATVRSCTLVCTAPCNLKWSLLQLSVVLMPNGMRHFQVQFALQEVIIRQLLAKLNFMGFGFHVPSSSQAPPPPPGRQLKTQDLVKRLLYEGPSGLPKTHILSLPFVWPAYGPCTRLPPGRHKLSVLETGPTRPFCSHTSVSWQGEQSETEQLLAKFRELNPSRQATPAATPPPSPGPSRDVQKPFIAPHSKVTTTPASPVCDGCPLACTQRAPWVCGRRIV